MTVTANGDLYSWGCGLFGALGHRNEEDLLVPKKLDELLGGSGVVMVAAGMCHSIAVTAEGALFAWGGAPHGQLGLGDKLNRLSPTLVVVDESMVRMAACGDHHTLAVTEEGTLFSWGSGSGMNASTATSTAGVLGHNDNNNRLIPTRVDPQHFDCAKIVTAAAGTFHSTAVTEDGALYTWGAAFDPEDEEDDQVPAGLGHADMLDKLIPRASSSTTCRTLALGAARTDCPRQ